MEILNNKKFEKFYELLISTNKQFNLTAITERDEVYEKHFFDSLAIEKFLTTGSTVIDVGTGAGFPAIPLCIARGDLKITAIDALAKRVNFLHSVVNQIGLTNLTLAHARAEDYAKTHREQFDFAVARAVSSLNTLLEYLAPFVKVGGKIVVHKADEISAELEQSKNALQQLGLMLEGVEKYKLPNLQINRSIVIMTKTKPTPTKFPRPQNKPKTNPL